MASPFLTKENFKDLWEASKSFHDRIRKPYEELERVKNNHPHPDIDPIYPKTTDGTTAAQIRQVPRRAVQQVPYGNATVKGDDSLSCLANFILTEEIIPNSDSQDMVLAKVWKGVEDIQTYGSCDAMVFYKVDGDYFGTDFKVVYKRNVYTEAGKGTFSESNIVFVRDYYQKTDIQKIIDKEESLKKSSESREEKYTPTWDIQKLKNLLVDKSPTVKDAKEKSDSETDRDIQVSAYKFVHGLQVGKKAKFFTYCIDTDEFVREWTTTDPRGKLPLSRMYYENDLSNPDGRGIVELVAPLQNYLDSTVQAWQYSQAYNISPALLKRGNFNKTQIKLRPRSIIDLGSGSDSSLEAFTIDSSAITNFSNTYGLVKSQILNLFGGDDQSISASVGNPGFSKTDAGVDARQAIVGINDNFVRKRVENWLGEIWGTQLNIYFSVTQGDRDFYPSKKHLEKLSRYPENEYYTVKDNIVTVHFSEITDKEFEFEIEASTSKSPDSNEAKDKLLDAVKTLRETGLIEIIDSRALARRILVQSNVDDVNELLPEEGEESDQQILQNLMSAGYPQEIAMKGVELERQGYTPEQIDQVLGQMMGGQNGQ